MPQIRHLAHAPIKEALIDIQVTPPLGFDVDSLADVSDSIKNLYPQSEDKWELTGEIQLGFHLPTPEVKESRKKLGFQRRSSDGNKVVQFRTNGFTFNWLEPYLGWDSLISRAREAWIEYSRLVENPAPTRIGIRYINHLKFSRQEFDFQRFFVHPIQVPDGLPTTLSGYLNRISIEDPASDLRMNLVSTVLTEGDSITFVLDTDVYSILNQQVSQDSLWESLDRFREMKNRAFFGTLTEECIQRYE